MQLLKFQADWCGPCKTLTEVMKGIEHYPIDVDSLEGMVMAKNMNVKSIPTLILLDDEGLEISRVTGLVTKEYIRKMIGEE